MKTESIIEGFNRYIEGIRKQNNINKKGHIVIQKTLEPKAFKVYKECVYTIWFICNRKKYEIFKISKIDKIQEGQEETLYRLMDIRLCELLFDIIKSSRFDDIVNCNYGN